MMARAWPALDREISPYTGWRREHLLQVADSLLDGAIRYTSPGGARIAYPGAPGGNGPDVDGLEGFARTFMTAAFRIAGDPVGTSELADRFARGIASGVDSDSSERWPRLEDVGQAKVEAAALALGLHIARDQVWARLDDRARGNVVDYLSGFIGGAYPPSNWAWFRIVVEQFLANVGAEYSASDIDEDFALLDGFEREHGWSSDGSSRAYDHYSGWALRLYPIIWADMVGDDPAWAARATRYRTALDDYLDDSLHLIGADGAPLAQGRSLVYRFATAGPAWAAAFSGASRHDPGLLRRAAIGQVAHFVRQGAPDANGLLTLGWHGAWRDLAQVYSGPGSPHWAAKGLLGIALPPEHPVWTAKERPLPADRGPFVRAISAPGWVASGSADGIVRVVNHGTDHKNEGEYQPDGPLYAKLGYSTATFPVLRGEHVIDPLDQHVGVLREGKASHRSGFARGRVAVLDEATAIASSRSRAHWPLRLAGHADHGHGDAALETELGPWIDIVSVVRGSWEVRFVRVHVDSGASDLTVRIGGWGVTGETGLETRVVPVRGLDRVEVAHVGDVTPLDGDTIVPYALGTVTGDWQIAALSLGVAERTDSPPTVSGAAPSWTIRWGTGSSTHVLPGTWCHTSAHEER
ncbi:DUF2264 domain-containing protein [Microbacterium suaedae]|uniref:DUF2264 domain-containing protein n=1 Tax=Microbacterium suaedae TaxID=2067813 RepID=UPI000DA1E2EE|nr:DUF2264 domain-containing protein [Microbacterium suaedae]